MVENWRSVPFEEIDVEQITQLSDEYFIKVTKCESRLPDSSAVMRLSQDVRNFKSTMPIVTALGNKKLEDYHWDEITAVIDLESKIDKLRLTAVEREEFRLQDKKFNLGMLIKLDIGEKQEEVVHISTTAT